MSELVSKCVLRLEVNDSTEGEQSTFLYLFILIVNLSDTEGEASTTANQKFKGQRKPSDISVETFPSRLESPREDWGLLPISSRDTAPVTEKEMDNDDDDDDGKTEIGFFSGNPFVEITKGILHLYKEE